MKRDDLITAGLVLSTPIAAFGFGAMKGDPELECSRQFYPAHLKGGARSADSLRLIVLHSTESAGTAAAVASYFQSESAGGSTQLVVGEDGCFRCVDDLRIPAGAPGANMDGLHVEIVGFASWSREEWLSRAPRSLALASQAIAMWSVAYGIPIGFLNAEGLKNGWKGVTTHAQVSAAYHQTDHTDPGAEFPLDLVMGMALDLAR